MNREADPRHRTAGAPTTGRRRAPATRRWLRRSPKPFARCSTATSRRTECEARSPGSSGSTQEPGWSTWTATASRFHLRSTRCPPGSGSETTGRIPRSGRPCSAPRTRCRPIADRSTGRARGPPATSAPRSCAASSCSRDSASAPRPTSFARTPAPSSPSACSWTCTRRPTRPSHRCSPACATPSTSGAPRAASTPYSTPTACAPCRWSTWDGRT